MIEPVGINCLVNWQRKWLTRRAKSRTKEKEALKGIYILLHFRSLQKKYIGNLFEFSDKQSFALLRFFCLMAFNSFIIANHHYKHSVPHLTYLDYTSSLMPCTLTMRIHNFCLIFFLFALYPPLSSHLLARRWPLYISSYCPLKPLSLVSNQC